MAVGIPRAPFAPPAWLTPSRIVAAGMAPLALTVRPPPSAGALYYAFEVLLWGVGAAVVTRRWRARPMVAAYAAGAIAVSLLRASVGVSWIVWSPSQADDGAVRSLAAIASFVAIALLVPGALLWFAPGIARRRSHEGPDAALVLVGAFWAIVSLLPLLWTKARLPGRSPLMIGPIHLVAWLAVAAFGAGALRIVLRRRFVGRLLENRERAWELAPCRPEEGLALPRIVERVTQSDLVLRRRGDTDPYRGSPFGRAVATVAVTSPAAPMERP